MGICFSYQIKADSSFRTDTGTISSKRVSGDGTELSSSRSKRSSSSVPPTPRSEGEILQSSNWKSFSFSDLKAATRNFRPDSVLGEGGFGSVFKGWIDEQSLTASRAGSGVEIAIKRLNQDGWQGHKEWLISIIIDGSRRAKLKYEKEFPAIYISYIICFGVTNEEISKEILPSLSRVDLTQATDNRIMNILKAPFVKLLYLRFHVFLIVLFLHLGLILGV